MPAVRRICRGILPAITIAGATVTASAQSGEIQLAANGAGVRLETQSMHASHVYVDDNSGLAPAPLALPRNMSLDGSNCAEISVAPRNVVERTRRTPGTSINACSIGRVTVSIIVWPGVVPLCAITTTRGNTRGG